MPGKKRRITNKITKEILQALLADGISSHGMRKILKTSHDTLMSKIAEFGLAEEYKLSRLRRDSSLIEKEDLTKNIDAGFSRVELAKKFKCSTKTIRECMDKFNLAKRPKIRKRRSFSRSEEEEIVEMYLSGIGANKIGKSLNKSGQAILRILEHHSIKKRGADDSVSRKYKINETFFEKIDTEEKAYFLGLLYADGYIDETSYSICISLENKDKYLLEKLSSLIYKENKPLYSRRNMNRVSFYSKKLAKGAVANGLFQAKSLTLKFPIKEQVPSHLMAHFIRGHFDGDGCIRVFQRGKTLGQSINILGSESFIKDLQSYLETIADIKSTVAPHFNSPKCFTLRFSKKESIIKMYNFLYRDCSVFMRRKKEKFELLFK